MKKIIFLQFLVFGFWFLVFVSPVQAADKAQELLDRVATKVAEIAKDYQKPYQGKISSLGAKTIALKTFDGPDKTIFVSEATTYFRIRTGQRTAIDLKSLKVGDTISALGTIDPATGELSAKQIIAKIRRENVFGRIIDSDPKKGLFSLAPFTPRSLGEVGPNSVIVDIDPSIAINKVATDSGIIKAKYADITEDSFLSVIGYYDPADTSSTPNLLALKILIF